jgi:uncharacterized LabA/DUF88 family protein
MRRKSKQQTYAFIDSQNLNLGIQKLGWHLDWYKFREYLRREHNVVKAYMFIGYLAENEALYDQLKAQGYELVHKPILEPKEVQHDDSYGEELAKAARPPVKGNIDAELVLFAMKELPNYKKAIIVSGDGDFYCLVEYLAGIGKLSALLTPNWQYSGLFKDYEKYVVRLDKKRGLLAYKPHHNNSKKREQPSA